MTPLPEPFAWRRQLPIVLGCLALFWLADGLIDALFPGDPLSRLLPALDRRQWSRIFSTALCLLVLVLCALSARRKRGTELSEQLSRIVFESAGAALCLIETQGRAIREANGSFLARYGLSQRDAVGRNFSELVGHLLPEEVQLQLEQSIASGNSASQEISYLGSDGQRIYEEVSDHPMGHPRRGVARVLHVTRDLTALRRSEAALRESEARCRAIFETTGTAMAIIRPDGVLHRVNRDFAALTGHGVQELEGTLPLSAWLSDHDRQVTLPLLLAAGEDVLQGFELQTPDRLGNARTLAGNWAAIAGTKLWVLSLWDVGAQKRAEEALRESRATLAVVQRIARLGNWEWDLTADALSWSEEMYRIFEVEPGQFNPTHDWVLQAIHPEDRERVVQSVNAAIYHKKGYHLDYRILLPGGVVRTISARGEVTYDARGNPLRMVGTNQDVTWRDEAEQALRHSEAKFSKAFHGSPDSIAITRAEDGTYIDVNDAFLDHTGYARDEVIGKNAAQMKLWSDPEARMEMLRLLNRYGRVRNLEVRFRMKSGEIRELLWSADVMEYQGEACLIAISRDVTDQRHLEKELLESDARLFMKHEELVKLFQQMEGIRREWEETMDCLSDIFIVADESGKVRRFNRALETFTGKAHREIVGREFRPFLREHGLEAHLLAPGTELLHERSGKWFVLKRYAFQSAELDGLTREVVIINDTSSLGLRPA